jgi:hypothetical protein
VLYFVQNNGVLFDNALTKWTARYWCWAISVVLWLAVIVLGGVLVDQCRQDEQSATGF